MSYVTMVFQRVFGYPREKAERHMLEVHQKGRSILWAGMRERCRALCAAVTRLSSARHSGKTQLIWRFAGTTTRSRLRAGPVSCRASSADSASASPDGVPTAEQRLFSSPTNGKEPELCAEWKQYVEPELRRLFQSATETVAADLEQLNGNEKAWPIAPCAFPRKHTDAWLNALNQARLVIAAKITSPKAN